MTSVTAPGPAVRRRRAVAAAGLAIAAALGTAACGEQSTDAVAARARGGEASGTKATAEDKATTELAPVLRLEKGADTPRLRCPTGERSIMIADVVRGAEGAPTPEDAVGLSSLEEGEQLVIGPRGGRVWIVRADGSAREEIDLIRSRGWLLHMRESCA